MDGLTFMEGTHEKNFQAVGPGKVITARRTDVFTLSVHRGGGGGQ